MDNFSAQCSYVANDGPSFTFMTNKDAPKYKVVRVNLTEVDVDKSDFTTWQKVIAESEDILEWVGCVWFVTSTM